MPESDQSDVIRLANEIRRYLETHPNAADTINGITRWWLPRQRFEETATKIQQAMEYLESEAEVKRETSHSGEQVYYRVKRSPDGTKP